MKRRDAVELLVIGSAVPLEAQVQHQHQPSGAAVPLQKFLSPGQLSLVDVLAEMILNG